MNISSTITQNLNKNINLDTKINEIIELFGLINKLNNSKKKNILLYKFESELDFMIDRLEDYYYRYVLKNKSEKNIVIDAEKTIYNSKKTMEAFMPYILLYNITENYRN
tara:strand:+ start:93 stop:419 length:327 start_codon:yes stop_codon:yes gene_type:complete